MAALAAASLLSAFLSFQLQPMIAKAILPWFGGSPAVWTTSLLFFQTLLLAGYACAHGMVTRWTPRRQAAAYVALLVVASLWLPLEVSIRWKPSGDEEPLSLILALLTMSVGLPYLALAAASPLLQSWAALREESPYRLYAFSNAGSLVALLSYPVFVEPLLTSRRQLVGWSCLYVAYVVLVAVAALRARELTRAPVVGAHHPPPGHSRMLLYGVWPACASALLLAATNQMCQDVAVVPFLWLLPLTLYLLSFILCFAGERWYRRPFYFPALLVTSAMATYAVILRSSLAVRIAIAIYATHLFAACMVCHGELFRLRPRSEHLTRFYLMISLGGMLGGAAVALIAPLVFPLYFELHVAIVACLVVAALSVVAESPQRFGASRWWWLAWFETTLAIAALLFVAARGATSISRLAARNFYGALRVVEIDDVSETLRRRHLVHGLTDHGFQFTSPPRRRQPTSYYSPRSGIGIVLSAFCNDAPRRVAVLGLGVGTIAAYGRPGDEFRFFEINPLVVSLAKNEFSFLADSAARIDVRVGDARLALERDDTPRYDILVADAFTSDAIPVHLLTEEAFRVYFARLAPGGVLAIHISNRVLDLRPVVAAAADALGAHIVFVNSDAVPAEGSFQAHWALLSREERSLASLPIPDAGARVAPPPERRVLWRDDYSNLLGILK